MYDIYANDHEDQWRYTLGQSGKRPLLTIGLNPSTATREKSDPTVARVERIANAKGFKGFVMLNLYPVRATDFRILPAKVDKTAFKTNLRKIKAVVAKTPEPTVWAAWGESVLHHDYFLDACIELLATCEVNWVHFGTMTESGHPRHPSRVTYAWEFFPLDRQSYLKTLQAARDKTR